MALTGTFTSTGQSGTTQVQDKFNVLISGGSATVALEKSYDNGSNWYTVTGADGTARTVDTSSGSLNTVLEEPEQGVLYRLNCTAYTSGTVNYRISQQ